MTAPYRFGRFEIQPGTRRLLDAGTPVTLGQRGFDLLLALVERRERVVPKGELLDLVWPGLVVEENNLQVQVSALRKVLGPQAIATIPGRGYRFAATLDDATGGAAAMPPGSRDVAGNLPRHLPPLFGRDAELDALATLVKTHRLVTVVGAGGIGKSRLALACAHLLSSDYVHGTWLVELAGVADGALLADAVARAVGLKLAAEASALDALVDGLTGRTMLLVLDNCEHLLDAVSGVAEALLRRTTVTILATSQEPLRIDGEQQYRIAPLDDDGGVALLEARARAADARFALTDDTRPLARDVCRRLDGLPLAIELAAGRIPTLGLRGVRDKLDARFKLLTGGARSTLRRHQTLRAALEWSHHLLSDGERVVFRRLGAFAGGFTVRLAQEAVGDDTLDEWAVLDHLAALVDKSLVTADAGDPPRYRLLESARAYALEQLAGHDGEDAFRRHAVAMRNFIRGIDDANIDGEMRTDEYAALVVPELDNLRAAFDWASDAGADPMLAAEIAAHSGALVDYAIECSGWLLACRPWMHTRNVDDALAARYWRALAAGNMSPRVEVAEQAAAAERAQAIYRALDQPRRIVSSLVRLAVYQSQLGNAAGAARSVADARALMQPDWPPEFRIVVLRRDATLARTEGRFADALELMHEEIRIAKASGDRRLHLMARSNVVDALWESGRLEDAVRAARELEAEGLDERCADTDTEVFYANLMGILSEKGDIDEAWAVARRLHPILRRTGSYFLENYVHLLWRTGEPASAARLLGAAEARPGRSLRQVNEIRLVAKARPGLEDALGAEEFAKRYAEGAALDDAATLAAIEASLR